MTGHDTGQTGGRGRVQALATREDQVALAASMGRRHRAIAEDVGLSERQIRRILERPEVRAKVAGLRAEALERAAGRLSDLAGEAVDTLAELMRAKDSQDTVRLAAARAILATVLPVQDAVDVAARLDALEQAQDQAGPYSGREAA